MVTFSFLSELFFLTTVISLMVRGRMRARKTAGMLCVEAGARREANKHQLQAGYSLQIMSFGHGWAIDVTILCFSNDAHVGHQLQISCLSVVPRRSHFVVVLALAISSSFPPCRISLFLLSCRLASSFWMRSRPVGT